MTCVRRHAFSLLAIAAQVLFALWALGPDTGSRDPRIDQVGDSGHPARVGASPVRSGGGAGAAPRADPPSPGARDEAPSVSHVPAPSTVPAALTGRVVDDDGRGVAAARVRLCGVPTQGTTNPPVDELTTDATGTFHFAQVPPVPCRLDVEADGYGPAWTTDVVAGASIVLRLAPAAQLEVEVRGEDESPAPDAWAEVARPGFSRRLQADAFGHVRFEGLPAGPVEVRAFADASAAAPQLVFLWPGGTARIVCVLAPPQLVRGRVVELIGRGEGARPLAGARVVVQTAGAALGAESTATTDRDGSFRLEAARAGADGPTLIVTKNGYADERVSVPIDADVLEIALVRQRSLRGRVVDPQGRAVSSARVRWVESDDDAGPITTDARGSFRVPLPPSPARGGLRALYATTSDGRLGAAAVRIDEEGDDAVIVLRDGGTVSGTVRDADGLVVPRVLLQLEPSGASVHAPAVSAEEAWARGRALSALPPRPSAVSDAAGRFRLTRVPAGAWTIRLVHDAQDERIARPVLLPAGAELTLDLTVGEVVRLSGRVVGADARGVGGARVLAVPADGAAWARTTTTAADGTYRFDALRADVPFTITASAPGYAPTRLRDVAPDRRNVEIRLLPPLRIEGRLERRGRPYASPARVWLVAGTSREEEETGDAIPVPAPRIALSPADEEGGRFSLPVPHAGTWLVCAANRDGTLVAAPHWLQVAEGEGLNGLVLVLEPAATLRGHAGPHAVVSVHAESGRSVTSRPLQSVRAGADGAFSFDALPAGRLEVRAIGMQGDTGRREIDLAARGTAEVDLTPPRSAP